MITKYPLPKEISTGELIYIHGIHNPKVYSWGWAMVLSGPVIVEESKGKVQFWKVLFRGKLVQLRLEEFTRFAWYNKHLFYENCTKMVP